VGSACLLNDGQQCSLVTQCASGICTPFYQDIDGDGYGAGPATGFCGSTTPVGYSAQTGDCCDSATNLAVAKLIHPNAGFHTVSAGGVCGITWDYDCDGLVETSFSMTGCGDNSVYPTCAVQFTDYPPDDCGMLENDLTCGTMTGVSSCIGFATGGGTLGCK
jgi:hypothetical protein